MSEMQQTHEALDQIAKESPEAVALVATIMEHNARERESIAERLLESEKRRHALTIRELKDARLELATIKRRIAWLMGGEV